MKKQNPIILQIPKPCTESWTEMKPMGLGRFCVHCQKTVTDITQMSDTQVAQLFQQNSNTYCIRALASQLNRPITLAPQVPTRFYRIALALGLTIMSFAAADTYARPRPPFVEQNYLLGWEDSTKKESVEGDNNRISGIVLDETGNPFSGVIVKVKSGGLFNGGDVTDDNGSFSIHPINKLKKGLLHHLEVSQFGYQIKRVVFETFDIKRNLVFKVKLDIDDMGTIGLIEIVAPTKNTILKKPGQKTFNANDLKKMGY